MYQCLYSDMFDGCQITIAHLVSDECLFHGPLIEAIVPEMKSWIGENIQQIKCEYITENICLFIFK